MSYQQNPEDDGLAYGDDYTRSRGSGGQGGTDRSLVGDTFRKFKSEFDKYKPTSSSQNPASGGSNQQYYGQQGPNTGYPQTGPSPYSQPGQAQYPQSQTGQPSYSQPGQSTLPQSQPGQASYSQPGQQTSGYQTGASAYPGGPPTQPPQGKPDFASKLFGGLHNTIQNIGSDVSNLLGSDNRPPSQYSSYPQGQSGYAGYSNAPIPPTVVQGPNSHDSFASEKPGNDVKWYVDGCGYFWAVSQALEGAKNAIWILDWWLSPELYLRRPPSQNEQWRLDRVLQRAAQRGVKVKIIVYKEVTQALSMPTNYFRAALACVSGV